jgi:hypothetical protein
MRFQTRRAEHAEEQLTLRRAAGLTFCIQAMAQFVD